MRRTIAKVGRNTQRGALTARGIGFALVILVAMLAGCGSNSGGPGSDSGQAGSQARFAIAGNYLYTVSFSNLQIFDITTASNPIPWSSQKIGFGIETIFSHNQFLFIGSRDGIFIYDNTNPQFPQRIGSLLHARSCDPVVVEGNYAYVTLRSGNRCSTGSNQLDIIDVSTISQPTLVMSYAMQSPSGLGVDGGKVFICDGQAGLKVFNVADPKNILLIDQVAAQNCFDVIPQSGRLIVSGSDGLYQYDYSTFPMTALSKL